MPPSSSSSSSPGRHGHGRESGDEMAAGQEVHHRSVRVRDLQGAERRETTSVARDRSGYRVPAGPVANGRRCGRVEEYEEDHSSEMFTSLKNNIQLSDAEKLLLRLNLFPNFSQDGRRMSIGKKHEKLEDKKPIIHLTTNKPLEIT
uniref:Uncharacterized protein n=1 Tax=Sipha flava TaxID=143950 RepID=A0A2S2QUM1_9HEMI